ncbi:aminotransferase class III-fold pyridoxal phosphate-dependent enzyme [Marivibrio halodurans]|nr:aminotransferase class III-fold pyridoxal phosphate-dependent enzyme [Marivibrio halodurans]
MKYEANSLENLWMPFTANRDFKASPRLVVKSEGVYLWNHEGGRLIDGSSSLFNVACGHGRKEIAEAVSQQLHECDYSPSFQMGHPWSFELAQKVTRLTPDEINHVFFTNSGSESIDTALKMAMAYHRARGDGQRLRFVSRERAYHGVNMGGVSLAGMVKNRETFQAVLPNVVHMRHTWLDANRYQWGQGEHGADLAEDLQRAVDTYGGTTIAACFVEPIAGSTGCLVPPKGYLERLREICDANGILLVFDEVITGFGRLGKPFAAQAFGVTPDIMTMAKAITNGAQPMGAVAVKDSLYETITEAAPEDAIEFFHGYTYSGHPAACAAGIATMDIYEREGLFDRAAKLAPYFEEKMMGLKDIDAITDIRGYGLMSAFDIKGDGNAMQKIFFKNGLHVKFTGNAGIVAPPLVVEEAQIDDLVAVIRKCLTEN